MYICNIPYIYGILIITKKPNNLFIDPICGCMIKYMNLLYFIKMTYVTNIIRFFVFKQINLDIST